MFLFAGCSVTKHLPEGSYLLTKNKVHTSFPDTLHRSWRVSASELERFIPTSQTPNKRIFGMPFFLWVYNLSDTTKNNWWQRTLRKIGEEPVLLDSASTERSRRDMSLYMQSKGFYESNVTDTIKLHKRKASVDYSVTAGEPFKISGVSYLFSDKSLRNIILADSAASLIKPGDRLDRTVMEAERSRVAAYLENLGYYRFSVNNIRYIIDTLGTPHEGHVTINFVQNVVAGQPEDSRIYRIRNVYIDTDYKPMSGTDSVTYDTLYFRGLNFIAPSGVKRNIRYPVIADAITIYQGSIYSREEVRYTSANISNLRYFRNVNILFSDSGEEDDYVTYVGQGGLDSLTDVAEGTLDCYIQCVPMLRQGYKLDVEASTNTNYTGIALQLGYANKNIFKGAEIFDISGRVAYDFTHNSGKKNSYEFGISTSLTYPRALVPFNLNRYSRRYNVSSKVELSFSKQRRPDYDRTLSSLTFGYNWSNGRYTSYTFRPINLSLIKVPWINEDYLNSIKNPYLRNSYTSQMILGMFGSVTYNTQGTGMDQTFTVKGNLETSGNFLNLISVISESRYHYNKDERYYNALGIRYAQYARAEASFVFRQRVRNKGALLWRFLVAGGYAYGNTRSMPFERMIFAGGSTSMRGWQVRTLGPGFVPQQPREFYPNQVGDLKIETTLEQRFPIYGPVYGAIFLDCGNIWSNGKGESDKEARFYFDTFYKQLALNTGLGLRLDFNYFVLRLDWGIQLRNPGWERGHEWIRSLKFSNTALHFGIGYPF